MTKTQHRGITASHALLTSPRGSCLQPFPYRMIRPCKSVVEYHCVYSFLTTQSNSTDALIGRGCIRSGVTINPKTLLLAIFLGTLLLAFLVRPAHPTHARPRTAAPVASYRSEMTGTPLGRRKPDICLPHPQAFACPLWEMTRYRVSGLYQSHGRELCQYSLSLTCVSHNARSSFGLCAL